LPGNPSLRRALRALAAREESGKGRFVFLRLKLPMFKKPGDDSFYAFTRGYLGNDKFNIFLM